MKFLICDGLSIVRRVYEANMEPDSPEKVETGLRSAFFSFKRVLREQQPTHALAAFDYGGQTWRHELYPAYKANRKPMYEVLREALPAFKERLTNELGIPVITKPGVEADDVIATAYLGWAARFPGKPAVVSTTDKDMTALVQHGATIINQFDGVIRDADWILKTWGILPHQVQDYLALMGDSIDNVPGVTGVGKKTAMSLLNTYGSLEAILAADVPGSVGGRLKREREMALLSKALVSFRTEYKIGLKLSQLELPK